MSSDSAEIQVTLIKRAQKGDQQSMYRLYKMYAQAMYNTCIRMVKNKFDAEDIIQETFISAFNKLETYRGESSFGVWLKRITINKSLDFLRKKKYEFSDVENIQIPDNAEDEDIPEIAPEKIHSAIKELPEKTRVIVTLYLLEGYKHREIAKMLKVSESTSKSQYIRGKKLLQEKLKNMKVYEN